jgi:hypothetical protein
MTGTYTITVTNSAGCTASASTAAVSVGYGTNVLDASTAQQNSITTTGKGEIIVMDVGTYGSGYSGASTTVNGSTTGVTAFSGNGTGTNTSMKHYTFYYLAATAATYSMGGGASGASGYWAQTNMAIKNSYGCILSATNLAQSTGANYIYNANTATATVTTTSVPVGSFLGGCAYDDGGTSGTAAWTCSPQTGWTATGAQNQPDSDGDNDMNGGVTITAAGAQTVTCTNSGANGNGIMMTIFWVHTP